MTILQRIRDWLLERRIAKVQCEIDWLMDNDPSAKSNCYDHYYTVSCLCAERVSLEQQRSPQQLARMKGRGE